MGDMIAYNTNSEDGYVMTSIDWVAGRRENEEGFLEGGFGSKRLVDVRPSFMGRLARTRYVWSLFHLSSDREYSF